MKKTKSKTEKVDKKRQNHDVEPRETAALAKSGAPFKLSTTSPPFNLLLLKTVI